MKASEGLDVILSVSARGLLPTLEEMAKGTALLWCSLSAGRVWREEAYALVESASLSCLFSWALRQSIFIALQLLEPQLYLAGSPGSASSMRVLGECTLVRSGENLVVVRCTLWNFYCSIFSFAAVANFCWSACTRAAVASASFNCRLISSSIILSRDRSCGVHVRTTTGKSVLISAWQGVW